MDLQASLPLGRPKTWKARYTVLTLVWLTQLLSFLGRMVMSVSLPYIDKDLDLDMTRQGLTVNAFFIGYAAFQIPGGLLTNKFGSRKTVAIGIIWWSVFISLAGAVLTLPLISAIRSFFSVDEGCFPSASWKMISTYSPSKERGRTTAIQSTVNTLGPALTVVVAVDIIGAPDRHMVFIMLSIPGLFIAADIYLFTRDNPKGHPAITQQDLAELTADGQGGLQNTSIIAFENVLKMPMFWQIANIWFLFNITFWGFSAWLPGYLITIREFPLAKISIMVAIPFLFGVGGTLLGGYCSDKFKPQRKTLYVVTSVIATRSLYLTFSVNSADMAVVYQCVSTLLMFFAVATFWGILMDTVPNNIIGRASGIVNFDGQMVGAVSAPIISWLVQSSGGGYNNAFIFMIAVLLCSAVVTLTVKSSHATGALPSKA